jgi:NADPH:quinone reductase-like Zn-dependent oxidoreductase
MRSLVAPKWCGPAKYEVIDLPLPAIEQPHDVIIKVHACGITPGDMQIAHGMLRFFTSME